MLKANFILLYFVYKYNSDIDLVLRALKDKEEVNADEINDVVEKTKSKFITILDNEYPEDLKKIDRPPIVLFYEGDISLLKYNKDHKLAVIGSRNYSEYGKEITRKIVSELEDDYLVISGLARGIDSISHETAIDHGLKTIAVLGDGLFKIYPSENKSLYTRIVENGGLVISEYHDFVEPQKEFFLARNRIVAALCNFLLVSEAYGRSGTQRTVSCALNYGKDVGCIPYEANKGSLCNVLIKEGAYLIENAKDISRALEKN
jgi:DNA processing protein